MGEYEDAIQALRDEGLDEHADRMEKFSNQEMRKRVGNVATVEKRNAELEAELATIKAAPKREAALKAAGVNVAALSPAEQEILAAQKVAEGKEYDEEWAKGLVQRYKLPVVEGTEEEEAPPNAGPMTHPGGPAGTPTPKGKMSLTPQEVNSWPAGKRMRFIEQLDKEGKMDVYERLLQGETVTGITFS